jgi:hypothetical protein
VDIESALRPPGSGLQFLLLAALSEIERARPRHGLPPAVGMWLETRGWISRHGNVGGGFSLTKLGKRELALFRGGLTAARAISTDGGEPIPPHSV